MRAEGTVLIIGGGIGGLATALALHQAGLRPLVFERAPELREVGSGLSLWPACWASRKGGAQRCGPGAGSS